MTKSIHKISLSHNNHYTISFNGGLLTESYGVYIIKVKREKQEFILLGRTEAKIPMNRITLQVVLHYTAQPLVVFLRPNKLGVIKLEF